MDYSFARPFVIVPPALFVLALSFFVAAPATTSAADADAFWPEWRGPRRSGFAPLAEPPLEWSETNHIRWKTKIPGVGTSTPIVWGNRVFIHTAIATGKRQDTAGPAAEPTAPAEPGQAEGRKGPGPGRMGARPPSEIYQFKVVCLDRQSGRVVWDKTVREEVPHEGHHPDHGYASASPVTDGQHVLAYFGSRGLHCLDLEGNLKWSKDFGPLKTRNSFGEGSSAALHGDTVVFYRDDETDQDFVAALDKTTGKELWRTPRNEVSGWSTPLIVEFGGRRQVVVNATEKVRSYDLGDGKELWSCAGQTANPIPTPVADSDTVYVTSGFRGSALFAIALGRTGDLTGSDAIRWGRSKYTPYVPSPLLVNGQLYLISGNNGVLSCFDTKNGNPQFENARLEGINGIYASPVAAKGRVYVLGRDGTCLVLKQDKTLEILARNRVDDKTDASIALTGKDLFIRGHQNLYCIGEEP
jgi:outer membrane protein assembly factor BamB